MLEHKLRYCSLPELLKEFFIRGKRSLVVSRHARQDDDHFAAHLGLRAQRAESRAFSSAASRTISARARASRTANGSSSRATNTTRRFSTSAASSSITCRKSRSSTTSSSITRTFSRTSPRSRHPSAHFIHLSRATACCSPTATTRTSRRCSNVTHCPVKRFGLGEDNAVRAFNLQLGPTAQRVRDSQFQVSPRTWSGELNVRNALAVVAARQALRAEEQANPVRVRHVQRHQAPHGSARHRGRRDGRGRFRPSSDGHPRNAAGVAAEISRRKKSGPSSSRASTPRAAMFFKQELVDAFARRRRAWWSRRSRGSTIAQPDERLDPATLDAGSQSRRQTRGLSAGRRMPSWITCGRTCSGGDVVCVFSNGGFGGIHGKLLERLGRRYAGAKRSAC